MSKTLYFDGKKFVHQLEESDLKVYQVIGMEHFDDQELATIAATLNKSNIICKIRQTKCQTEGNQE